MECEAASRGVRDVGVGHKIFKLGLDDVIVKESCNCMGSLSVYPAWHVFGMKLVANCALVKVGVVIVFFISKWDVNEQG